MNDPKLEDKGMYDDKQALFAKRMATDMYNSYEDILAHLSAENPQGNHEVMKDVATYCCQRWIDVVLQQMLVQSQQHMMQQMQMMRSSNDETQH